MKDKNVNISLSSEKKDDKIPPSIDKKPQSQEIDLCCHETFDLKDLKELESMRKAPSKFRKIELNQAQKDEVYQLRNQQELAQSLWQSKSKKKVSGENSNQHSYSLRSKKRQNQISNEPN